MINSGSHISTGIAGFSVSEKLAGWCRVYHHSTENLITGRLTTPTSARIAQALPAPACRSIAERSAITPIYKKNNTNVEVSLASHTHQVPQVGLPQIAPVTKARKVIDAPSGAIHFTATSASLILQIRNTAAAPAIIKYPDCARIAAGT